MKVYTLALVLAFVAAATARKNVVCYYGSWAVYRPGDGKFDVDQIDPFICTHLIYGFAGLREYDNTIYAMDPYNDLYENWGKGAFERFTGLKKINPSLTTLIAIGGWNEGSSKYSKMAATAQSRQQFIASVIPFVKQYGFDGLDMDWEYPTQRGGQPRDNVNFVLLMKELREAFDREGLLLTAAVSAGEQTIDEAYNIPEISKYLDMINMMAYDYHGGWEQYTGHNTPLFRHPLDSGNETNFNVDFAVNHWITKGADPSKINLGMALYGRGWTLNSASETGPFAPASNPIQAGPYTREGGIWGYNEICEKFLAEGNSWTVVRDPYYQAPYAYNGKQWIGYDDVDSLTKKLELIERYNLGGGMVWSIETDDFKKKCHSRAFPLISHIHEYLNGAILETTTPTTQGICIGPTCTKPTTASTTTIRPQPTTDSDSICPSVGYHRKDCQNYYYCLWNPNSSDWVISYYTCAPGTAYDLQTGNCNWANQVPGCGLEVSSA